jgi:23S rRNA pseudouridine1911/1915/1917 synthase
LSRVSEAALVRLRVDDVTADRLDAYMAERLPGFSRTRIAQLIEAGHVRLNGEIPRKRDRPATGDLIEMDVPPAEPSHIEAEAIPLSIAWEDENLLVVDKPAGLVVHPAPGHARGTLVNALLHHLPDLAGIGGVRRPGLVHRLDRDTSGLMIVAKTEAAHRRLSAALKRREIRRLYLCAAWGHVAAEELTVDRPIGRSPSNRKRMAVVQDGRPAITHLRRLERWQAADFLEARLETGRTHQIRVHLAALGHAVVGDREYGAGGERGTSGPQRLWARQLAAMVSRQFLHAAELAFRHPETNEPMVFRSMLPADLAAAAAWARESSSR